jgi:endonuclease/exonuclease/phosphatase family metal-dependent hydrolase
LLGEYEDGFTSAGSGFGYSYPSPRDPWMRIDRVLADKKHFRFRSFEVINKYLSDHFAITSELELVP